MGMRVKTPHRVKVIRLRKGVVIRLGDGEAALVKRRTLATRLVSRIELGAST